MMNRRIGAAPHIEHEDNDHENADETGNRNPSKVELAQTRSRSLAPPLFCPQPAQALGLKTRPIGCSGIAHLPLIEVSRSLDKYAPCCINHSDRPLAAGREPTDLPRPAAQLAA